MWGAHDIAFVRDDRVLWRHVFDGVLLCLPESGDLVTVTGPGAHLWEMLDEPRSIGTLTEELAQRFTGPADEIAIGIEHVLDDLTRRTAIRSLRAAVAVQAPSTSDDGAGRSEEPS